VNPDLHCWHNYGYTTTEAVAGGTSHGQQNCCWCAAVRSKDTKYLRDPAHGQFADVYVPVTTYGEPIGEWR
jgi:hypothetical protein